MNLLRQYLFSLLMSLMCLLPISLIGQSIPTYQETSGMVVIEIESAINYGEWEVDTIRAGYTGDNYLHYKGLNFYNSPGNSPLTFKVAIEKSGKYRFQWHSLIAVGDSNTDHNDSWLRFKDASDFYGQKNDHKVYPRGVGKTPNPEGSSKDGWLKIYQNNREGWTWKTRTNDNDPYEIFVEFDTVGIYTLEVSGRSTGHAIDRIVLYHSTVNSTTALNLANPESERLQTVSLAELPAAVNLTLQPTLTTNYIQLVIPTTIKSGQYEIRIVNLAGQMMQSFPFEKTGNSTSFEIPINQLLSGYYFVQFRANGVLYQGRFVKQ